MFICEVGRIHIESDKTSCQLIFTNSKNKKHIVRTRLNIETDSSRLKVAKGLQERYPINDFDWQEALEYIAEKTMRELEHGEPVLTLRSSDPVPDLDYLVYPLVPCGKPTAIFGDPGAGKTQTAVIINIIASLPWSENPLRLGAPKTPVKLLFLDYEADSDDIKRQLRHLTEGMELGYCELEYRRCSLPLSSDLEGIYNHIIEGKIGGLIIDSVSLAAGGDLNRMDVATNYIRSLRQLGQGLTTISFAHTSKDRDSKSKTILGSVLFEAGFRSVWEIRASEGDDSLDVALFHRKANLSRKFHDIGFRINYLPDVNTIEWLNPKSVPEFLERMSFNQQILQALKAGRLSSRELMEHLDIKNSTLRTSLARLKKAGKIIGDSESWGLAFLETLQP